MSGSLPAAVSPHQPSEELAPALAGELGPALAEEYSDWDSDWDWDWDWGSDFDYSRAEASYLVAVH
jgi:hypothetical protein